MDIIKVDEYKKKKLLKVLSTIKNIYNIDVNTSDIEKAELLLKALKNNESALFYEVTDEGKLGGFYPKIMCNIIYKEFKIINPNGQILIYDKGAYKVAERLDKYIEKKLDIRDKHITKNVKETLGTIEIQKKIDPNLLNNNPDLINFKNGLYSISKNELIPHTSEIYSTLQINANYIDYNINKQKFEESMFIQFLKTSFNFELIPTIQEMFGYCFSNSTSAQKMFILLGSGNNGKSVLIKILDSFFDNEFISSVELKDLQKPEFAARLFNKAINTCADISSEHMNNTGLIKQLTGEDFIEAKPLYLNPFRFQNKAKMIFSGNELPSTSDKTYAFIRRLIILNCNKVINDEDRIENLAEKIIGKELDYIASWAIDGLKRLVSNKYKFTECKEIYDSVEEYRLNNNSLASFINYYCEITNEEKSFIPKQEFTFAYKKYCECENSKPLGAKNINQIMKNNNIYEKSHTLFRGRYWNKISWKESIREFIESPDGEISNYDTDLPIPDEIQSTNINWVYELRKLSKIQLDNLTKQIERILENGKT